MKKLLLEEDNIAIEEPTTDAQKGMAISSLIKSTWDLVDTFNSIKLSYENNLDLDEEINDLYIIIGQLEGKLQEVNPQAELIDSQEGEVDIS